MDTVATIQSALSDVLDVSDVLTLGAVGLGVAVAYHTLRVGWTIVTLLADNHRESKRGV